MERLEKKLATFGMRLGLTRMRRALRAIGNPERNLRVILVAGTNGKGSVTTYLSGILRSAGYNVGSYFSPHLVRYNERWQINGMEISTPELRKYEEQMVRLSEKYPLTLFEALTAMAYRYFSDAGCDFAVMEVGMGGRLDATNVADAEIGIIAGIGLDHTQYLGRTLEKIAHEKAGILKKGAGIIGALGPEAQKIIQKEATARGIRTRFFGKDFECSNICTTTSKTRFDYRGKKNYTQLRVPLTGSYQAANAALAVAAAEELEIGADAIRKGLRTARIAGRMQILHRRPLILLDGAHNVPAMRELVAALPILRFRRLVVLFAAMHDKDWKGMLDLLAPKASLVIATKPPNPRAENPKSIFRYAQRYTRIRAISNTHRAFRFALSKTGKDDLLLVCGSLYLVGDVLKGWRHGPRSLADPLDR